MGLSESVRPRGGRVQGLALSCAPRSFRGWALGLLLVGLAAASQEPGSGGEGASDPPRAQEAIRALGDPSLQAEALAPLLQEAFDLFLARMEARDGPGAVGLARAMYGRAPAPWSAFCLEGALRRSSPADATAEGALLAYAEADASLTSLLRSEGLASADRLAVTQRRAILAAGFADRSGERAALGRALSRGGIDGAQIRGLNALQACQHLEAARLFGLLMDRGDPAADRPWALRGHGLASLESLREGS